MADSSAKPLPDVKAMLRQLRENYLAELDEKLGDIESDLLALERTERFADMFERAYRKVHSLKGSAGTYGLPIISKICHQLEEHLNLFTNDASKLTREVLDRCLAHINLMRKARDQAQAGGEHFNDIEEALNALRTQLLGDRYSVLIVETSKVNIKLCADIMKRYPVQVTILDNGYQALELLLQHKYHLLITGLEVKMLNGLALVAAVRMSARGNQDMQAIMLSSSKQPPFKRNIDPNYIVPRDSQFAENLGRAIDNSVAALREKVEGLAR
ncbi:MAG: Hpt domain-containing protein [Burkholderiales bacterium]|nr:Hpt domain-containing protein [Burkholderiales bacterium]